MNAVDDCGCYYDDVHLSCYANNAAAAVVDGDYDDETTMTMSDDDVAVEH